MKTLAALLLCIAVLSVARPVRADDLMLLEEPRKHFGWYGVLFLGLSIASFDVTANGYKESDAALKKANDNYKLYKAATTETDATRFHRLTEHYRKQAVGFETTGNAALILGVIFGATGVYSLFADDPNSPILVSAHSIGLRYRF
jgi:hypothetical protein